MVLKFLEVLDEHLGEFASFLVPHLRVGVSVAGIKNLGVHSGELGRDDEVEVGENLCGRFLDVAVEDVVDDTAGVGNGDTFASSVPACVHQVSLGTALLHLLDEFIGIFGGMEAEECLTEASREGGGGLSNATFRTGQLGGEAAKEVVLGLLVSKNGYGGQYAESISAEEDDLFCSRTFGYRFHYVLDVEDRI